jgi:hypothetical protein
MHVPPTNFDNFSRFAVAVDPQTATFGLISWLRPIRLLQAELNIAGSRCLARVAGRRPRKGFSLL